MGSSSRITFGSPMSRRMSCNLLRSPRNVRTGVHARSRVKPSARPAGGRHFFAIDGDGLCDVATASTTACSTASSSCVSAKALPPSVLPRLMRPESGCAPFESQQRGLASAVHADDSDALCGSKAVCHVVEDDLLVGLLECKRYVFKFQNLFPKALCRRTSSTSSRGGGSLAMSSSAASMRNRGLGYVRVLRGVATSSFRKCCFASALQRRPACAFRPCQNVCGVGASTFQYDPRSAVSPDRCRTFVLHTASRNQHRAS